MKQGSCLLIHREKKKSNLNLCQYWWTEMPFVTWLLTLQEQKNIQYLFFHINNYSKDKMYACLISLQFKYSCISEYSVLNYVNCFFMRDLFFQILHKYKSRITHFYLFVFLKKYLLANILHMAIFIQVPAHHQCANEIMEWVSSWFWQQATFTARVQCNF